MMKMTMTMSVNRRVCAAAAAAGLALTGCTTTPRSVSGSNNGPPAETQNYACAPNDVASRIPQTGPQCSAAGRSYSSDDFARTGATTAGQALQLLDPAITVSH